MDKSGVVRVQIEGGDGQNRADENVSYLRFVALCISFKREAYLVFFETFRLMNPYPLFLLVQKIPLQWHIY